MRRTAFGESCARASRTRRAEILTCARECRRHLGKADRAVLKVRTIGGRTRAQTWDPLIKRRANTIDISSEFSQLHQNQPSRDQGLTTKNPTMTPHHRWRIDGKRTPI